MELIKELELYVEQNSSDEPELLYKLRRETYQKTTHPHMLSGCIQGRILSMISKIISPDFIVEIGTFTGYSALCLAEGLKERGKLVTIDNNLETSYLPEKYFKNSEYFNQIKFVKENALDFIPTLKEEIDLVFLDADKENYLNYLELIKPKLRSGGIILADNILWKGQVINKIGDKKTELIKTFNKKIKEDNSLEVVILPVRDGISLIRKK